MRRDIERSVDGFTLMDLMITVAIGVTVAGIAVPVARRSLDAMKLSGATREVERELQTARLKAVANNKPIRVRLNCPTAGQFRGVEITGVTATDTDPDRCSLSSFPYPGPIDDDPATPSHDGPLRTLGIGITVSGPDLQFTPRGTAMRVVAGVLQTIGVSETISVTRENDASTVTVNGLGRIQLQQK